jgi:hypothetical protein
MVNPSGILLSGGRLLERGRRPKRTEPTGVERDVLSFFLRMAIYRDPRCHLRPRRSVENSQIRRCAQREGNRHRRAILGYIGLVYFIKEYPPTKAYRRSERVAYVQLPKAVAYIVLTADEQSAYRAHKGALEEAVKTILSMEVDYPGKPKNPEGR